MPFPVMTILIVRSCINYAENLRGIKEELRYKGAGHLLYP